jgi:pimeloyl-ACP methyl ester carboxylesterase
MMEGRPTSTSGRVTDPEHAVEMLRLHPRAQLVVLPGTDHFAPAHRAEWIVSMVTALLDTPMPTGN